jgi:uncharacterized protein (TIGR02679 family)
MTAYDLSVPEPLSERDAERIRQVLHSPSWRWLTHTVRATWEKDLSRQRIGVDLTTLEDTQVAAMADFLRWPTHKHETVTISLSRVDALLRASGLGAGLAACLTASGGPLNDEAARRRTDRAARQSVNDQLWAEAFSHPALTRHRKLEPWLADERRYGRIPADPQVRRRVLSDVLAVLDTLPHPGTSLAILAGRVLGYAHALDDGPVQAAVLRALAWLDDRPDEYTGAERRRTLWANAGVALDTVSSTVLTFGLILPGSGPVSTTLAANAAAALPVRLTLGQVRHYLDKELEPIPDGFGTVFACENPSVVEAASNSLATRSAPLISAEGRPSVAAGLLLRELREAGASLCYHGDFDWPGLDIARWVMAESGATPWRFGARDYREGLGLNPRPKRLSPSTGQARTPWDPDLMYAMLNHLVAVEEEIVMDLLLADLATGVTGQFGKAVTR